MEDSYAYIDGSGDVFVQIEDMAVIEVDSAKSFAATHISVNVLGDVAVSGDDDEIYTSSYSSGSYGSFSALSPSVSSVLSGTPASVSIDNLGNVVVVDDAGECSFYDVDASDWDECLNYLNPSEETVNDQMGDYTLDGATFTIEGGLFFHLTKNSDGSKATGMGVPGTGDGIVVYD